MTTVIHTLQQGFICESDVRSIRSNDDVEIEYGGAGNGDAFVKENYHYRWVLKISFELCFGYF